MHVNLGQPIVLDELLQKHNPQWRSAPSDGEESPPDWIAAAVAELAASIGAGINAAAAVTPINLVAMAVLATPRQALAEADLVRQVELYQRLLRDAPYAPLVTVTADSGAQMTRYAESMGMLERQAHPLGDIMRMSADRAVLATYYRNNILHLFAMPSLLACCFVSNARMRTVDIQRLVWRVYPYICAELALRWPEEEVSAVADSLLDAFARLNLLTVNADRSEWQRPAPTSLEAVQLSLLAEATIQTIERYYLVIALLLQAGSGTIGQEALEQRCHLMAQRMSLLYGLNSPEFFDKSLFRNFIELLCRRDVVRAARGRHAPVRGAAAGRRHRCAAGPLRADPARHPAGDARSVRMRGRSLPAAAASLPLGAGAALLRFDAPLLGCACGPCFLADLGLDQRRSDQLRKPLQRRAAVLLLAALAARAEHDAAVVDQLLSGEAAQPVSGGHRQAGVGGKQEPQLHRARHLVDVLPAGPRRADELPLQFLVGYRDLRGDDQRHGGPVVSRGSRGRRVRGSRAAPRES